MWSLPLWVLSRPKVVITASKSLNNQIHILKSPASRFGSSDINLQLDEEASLHTYFMMYPAAAQEVFI